MKSSIDKIFDKFFPSLSQKARNLILDLCEEHTIEKGKMLVEVGKREESEYLLLEGIVRSCLMNTSGELVTLQFFDRESILSPYVIRTENQRSLINIEALSYCRLASMEAAGFAKLIESNTEIREFANTVLRQELTQKTNKEIRLVSWTSKERLAHFRKAYDMLENRVPHSMIASYLGITHVSLSRLRKHP